MPQIDQGGFGFRSSPAVPLAQPTPASAFDQSGVQRLAAGVHDVATSEQDRILTQRAQETHAYARSQEVLQQKIHEEDRARSISALTDYDRWVRQAADSIAGDLQAGKIQREDVAGIFAEQEKQLRADTLSQIRPEHQPLVASRLDKASNRAQFALGKVVEQHRQSTILGYAGSITDSMAKQAVEPDADLSRLHSDYEQAMRTLMPDGGANPKTVEKAVQDFKDRTTAEYLVARLNERLDDLPGLRDLAGMVKDSKAYPNLDGEKRNVLMNSVHAAIARLEAKRAGDQQRVLAELAGDLSSGQKLINDGYTLDAGQVLNLQRRAVGTPLQKQFEQLNAVNGFIARYVHAPIDQMQTAYQQLDAQVRQHPTPEGQQMAFALRSLMASKRDGMLNKPYETSVTHGTAPFVALDFTGPKAFADSAASHVAAVRAQASQNPGQAGLGIFTDQDVEKFQSWMHTQPPQTKVEILKMFTAGINDPEVAAATLTQVSKAGGHMLAQAGMLALWGGDEAARRVLDGEYQRSSEAKGGAITIPDNAKFQADWRSKVGNSYRDRLDTEDLDFQAAKSIYASLARDAGKTAQTDVDSGLWRKAITLATGGHMDYKGANLVKPYRLKNEPDSKFRSEIGNSIDQAFQSAEISGAGRPGRIEGGKPWFDRTAEERYRLEAQWRAQADKTRQQGGVPSLAPWERGADIVEFGQISRDYMKDLPLESFGQGRYYIGRELGYLQNDAGHPLVLDLSGPVPRYYFNMNKTVPGGYRLPSLPSAPVAPDQIPMGIEPIVRPSVEPPSPVPTALTKSSDTSVELSPETATPISKSEMRKELSGAKSEAAVRAAYEEFQKADDAYSAALKEPGTDVTSDAVKRLRRASDDAYKHYEDKRGKQ